MKYFKGPVALLFLLLFQEIKGQEITLKATTPAYVLQGNVLNLTFQSKRTEGIYDFFANESGSKIEFGKAGGGFKTCYNISVDVAVDCDFTNQSWTFILTFLNPKHNQTIICMDDKNNTANSTIFVAVPCSEVLLYPLNQVEIIENRIVSFQCLARDCRPKANITWLIENSEVAETSNIPQLNGSLYNVYSTLTTSFQRKDMGKKIKCSAINVKNMQAVESEDMSINVLYAPSTEPVLSVLSHLPLDELEQITLQCSLNSAGNPPIKWNWMCGMYNLTAEANNTATNSLLTFTAKRQYNQKECHCLATSPKLQYSGQSETTKITVYYKPDSNPTLQVLTSLLVNEGDNVSLQCDLSTLGFPSITWSWVCGGENLSLQATNIATESTLTFKAYRKYNQKRCQCWATSPRPSLEYNRTSDIKTITVYYPPSDNLSISSSSQTFVFTSGDSVNLTCSVFGGNPIANLSWECNSKDLIPKTRSNSTLAASVLSLKVDKTFNNKDCTCTARHPLQEKKTTVMLIVHYESNITSLLQERYVINEKENFSLECTVDGNPLSNITWTFSKKGNVVNDNLNSSNCSLKIPSVKCSDHGEYIVVAENGIGRSSSKRTKIAVNCKPRLLTTDSQSLDKIGIGNNESLFINVQLLLFPAANTVKWKFTGNNNESYDIQNSMPGYEITNNTFDNEQNITLFKKNISDKEFGIYSLTVANSVGNLTKIYKVNGARSPLPPFNLTLVCDNPFSITLTWIADFNGGDGQIFHVFFSSGENNSSFKELTTIYEKGYGKIHSYSPAVELYGQLWFKIAASNKFGNSTTGAIPCFIRTQDESSSDIAMIAGIAAGGGICLAFVVIVVVVYFRKYYHQYEKSAKHIERLYNENEEVADVDGLKENSLYVSAGPRDGDKAEVAVYAAVAKKLPQNDNNANLYADVKKSGRQDKNKGGMSSEVKPKKGLFKKDEKAKNKKGKKPKNRPGETDVYENSEDIALSSNIDNVYSNAGHKGPNKQEERGYKNKDGLLYVEVNFDGKQGQDNPVIHGEDEKTDYATVEFPMPSSVHNASGGEEL